ncbi:hypothetical protein D0T25_14510 [Duganella sp. BJB488]|uniref:hypothetical protein n=1 Tax=unclassified Duganella TaxID=2636909 RepID=UPI000E353230|nr:MULTISPECIES: hypothetical protein [unclassified Duganella]RFP20457.1 hypothetical protein D0T26_14470 [Duganella sp. BJB489]RFP21104.1 hypothetical protein D0T25_14510 [Duganella sp. BJB488]RFP33242.1 hypothetical protein D0T24_18205 [Duganella sp. BJB480]
MPDVAILLGYISEGIKILGGLASFYALIKLRQIEKRYLFKATIPDVVKNLRESLRQLNAAMAKPSEKRDAVVISLNHLQVDVKNVVRKAFGDSAIIARQLLNLVESAQLASSSVTSNVLIDIYGKGMGLVRSLEHDQVDQGWSRK